MKPEPYMTAEEVAAYLKVEIRGGPHQLDS